MNDATAILLGVAIATSPVWITLAAIKLDAAVARRRAKAPEPDRRRDQHYQCTSCTARMVASTTATWPPSALPCPHCVGGQARRTDEHGTRFLPG